VKSKFSLFIAVAMMFALVFAGCAGEEADVVGEVEPVSGAQEEVTREEIKEINSVFFNGIEYKSTEEFMNSEIGKNIHEKAEIAITSLHIGDTETLKSLFWDNKFTDNIRIMSESSTNLEIINKELKFELHNIVENQISFPYNISYVGADTMVHLYILFSLDENMECKIISMTFEG